MTQDNVINFSARRAHSFSRSADAPRDRSSEAAEVLKNVSEKKRLSKDDARVLAANLGRLVKEIEPKDPKNEVKRILGDTHFEKRKRYVRFPEEPDDPSRQYAASGGEFAKIIRELIDLRIRKGGDHATAMVATINGALKGTSFRRSTQFRMAGAESDAAILAEAMEKVMNKLAQASDLTSYFEGISKFPIYPSENPVGSCSEERLLELRPDNEPNDLYSWESSLEDDELQNWTPWWAPRCLIGHLYICFQCWGVHVPKEGIAEIRKACGGDISRGTWNKESSSLLGRYLSAESNPRLVRHRLPIWLIVLPSPDRLVPCLHASIDYWPRFQVIEFLLENASGDAIQPCFVSGMGNELDGDGVYIPYDDDFDSLYYVLPSNAVINVIGSGINDMKNFNAGFFDPESTDELPDWLQPHPIQRLLPLTNNLDAANAMALAPRNFTNNCNRWTIFRETIFRPAFSDPVNRYTLLQQNTIAAYLLRNFAYVEDGSIFDALKKDVATKAAASRGLIEGEMATFKASFDKRYGD